MRLLTLAVGVAALLPRLAHRGMFLDGVTYASIARNLAEGRGRFWEPFYTATIYPAFHEHPPLGFWLQSLWFRVLGDHWFVERIYCATAAVAIAALIAATWRDVYAKFGEHDDDWLPIGFWMVAPVVSWAIVGNLLETTVCVFATGAVAAISRGTNGSTVKATVNGIVSGLCVAGAVLTKGPTGFFPLVAPVLIAMLPERRHRAISSTAAQWGTVAACALLLYSLPGARNSLSRYFDVQLMTALAGQREVSGSSMTIIVELVQGVWLPMAVAVGAIVLAARGWKPPSPRDRQVALLFMLIGLAGTLPIAISPKQTGHYLMPAVPFYAIAAAALAGNTTNALVRRANQSRMVRGIRWLAAAVAIGAVAAIWLPALERDPARLAALDRLAAVAPRGETIGICGAANGDWLLHAWLQRRFEISLDSSAARHQWFLKSTSDGPECPPPNCAPASSGIAELVLMRCR